MEFILFFIIAVLLIAIVYLVIQKPKGGDDTKLLISQMEALKTQVNDQLGSVNTQLQKSQGNIGDRLDNAAKVIGAVQKNLGELGAASKQIFEIGKDISSLQEILQPPKLRGSLGEVFLTEILNQVIPNTWEPQHRFKSGEVVDGVIKLGDKLVPVDSKFPLENFRKILSIENDADKKAYKKQFERDVKKHIEAIASKYILPDEGTYDFALMYIPAENVYYETIIKSEAGQKSLCEYANEKRIMPVSPNSLYAYLQTICYGLRGMQVEKHAVEIQAHLARLVGDFSRFTTDYDLIGNHLGNATKKYEEASKRLGRFEDKLLTSGEVAPELLEKNLV